MPKANRGIKTLSADTDRRAIGRIIKIVELNKDDAYLKQSADRVSILYKVKWRIAEIHPNNAIGLTPATDEDWETYFECEGKDRIKQIKEAKGRSRWIMLGGLKFKYYRKPTTSQG